MRVTFEDIVNAIESKGWSWSLVSNKNTRWEDNGLYWAMIEGVEGIGGVEASGETPVEALENAYLQAIRKGGGASSAK